jgi:hypothetical protein
LFNLLQHPHAGFDVRRMDIRQQFASQPGGNFVDLLDDRAGLTG